MSTFSDYRSVSMRRSQRETWQPSLLSTHENKETGEGAAVEPACSHSDANRKHLIDRRVYNLKWSFGNWKKKGHITC